MLVHDSNPRTSVKEEGRFLEAHGLTGLINEFLPHQSYVIRPWFLQKKKKLKEKEFAQCMECQAEVSSDPPDHRKMLGDHGSSPVILEPRRWGKKGSSSKQASHTSNNMEL